jgi:hypothetical protein
MDFVINGNTYPNYYLLADGISLMETFSFKQFISHKERKCNIFLKCQEPKKSVERCFGVLQVCFEII